MQTEQLAIDFAPPANLQKRMSIASGPTIQTEEMHFCNYDQYAAVVDRPKRYFEPTLSAWCGAEIVSGSIYPKNSTHVKCAGCWRVYERLEAQFSKEIFYETTGSFDEEESDETEEKDDGK